MSTKKLYTALLDARMSQDSQMICQMDEAIRKIMTAERELQFLNSHYGSDDLFRRRLKLILCEEATRQFKPVHPSEITGNETEQLQKLATAVGCPKLGAWHE